MNNIKANLNNYFGINITYYENYYKAKYLGDFSIKDNNGEWTNLPVSVFFCEFPLKPNHKQYFGLLPNLKGISICDATSILSEPITGVIADNNQVIFSGYTHDYATSDDGSVFIDGGRSYTRTNNIDRMCKIKIEHGNLMVI